MRKVLLAAIGMTIALLSVAGGIILMMNSRQESSLDTFESIQTSKTIYAPVEMPDGYKIDKTTIKITSDVVVYSITYDGDNSVAVTIQDKPKDVVFEDFYSRLLKNKADIFSKEGKAVIGNAENQTIGSLVTNDTWVLLSAKNSIPSSDMSQIVSSLAPLRP